MARTGPVQRLVAARKVFVVHHVRVQGCRIMARRSTAAPRHSAPMVVLIGGTALSGRYLLPTGVELAQRYPVWVPDLSGRGASEAPSRRLSVADHAELLAAWMGAVGVERAALVANSMGCQIAVEIAVRHPDRVSHLVLQGPTVDASARTLPRQALRLLLDSRHEPISLGPLEVVDWARAGLMQTAGQVRAMMQHRIEDRLPGVTHPTLVVRGARDAVVPARWAQEVAERLPDGHLRQIAGAAHAMVYTHPVELARVTEHFLERR